MAAERARTRKPVVVITGSEGLLGSRIAARLKSDYHVVGMDFVDPKSDEDLLRVDLGSDEAVEACFETFEERFGNRIAAVVHLAAYFDFSGETHPLYESVNVDGTRRLLRALASFDVERFVYASTMLVHAPTEPGIAIEEHAPLKAKWPYPQSKVAAEQVLAEEGSHLPWTVLRLAGVYDEHATLPLLAHQVQRIYERSLESHAFAGKTSRGQSLVHIDDAVEAFVQAIEKRNDLAGEGALLVGEPVVESYEALQNELGRLLHGERWTTLGLPKPVAWLGSWAQKLGEKLVPDAIDDGEEPFVQPFMIALADDHYELDISRAREQLAWEPQHSIREELPGIVEALRADPIAWYRHNGIRPPGWLRATASNDAADEASVTELLERSETQVAEEHARFVWAHFLNAGLGAWLVTSPAILGYEQLAMTLSDAASGILVMLFSLLSLSARLSWARWANASVGAWLMLAPLVFHTPSAAAYLNGTLVGGLVMALAAAVRPVPGLDPLARVSGPDLPPGWNMNPSAWTQRLPIIALAFVGLFISRYLAAYQLGHTPAAWDPFFPGGTERIITSEVSRAWPVSDAGLGALVYMLEILTGIIGGRSRWRTMPWLVMLFGFMIVPLGAVSLYFIVIQPIVIGTWCSLCLLAAAAMLLQIPYSLDELLATGQFLLERRRAGRSVVRVFFRGDAGSGGEPAPPPDFARPPRAVIADVLGGGVGLPWNLLASAVIGAGLMCTRLLVETRPPMAHADHLIGALVVTVSITALAECARSVRFVNALLGIALMAAPWMLSGGTALGSALTVLAGIALIVLSIPRGRVEQSYAGWTRWIL